MEFETIALIAAVIVVLVLGFYIFIRMMKNKNINVKVKSTVDISSLIEALGSIDNIIDVKSTPSKVSVTIKAHDLVQPDKIKQLGASGIVASKDSIAMIFGKESALIEEDIKNQLK